MKKIAVIGCNGLLGQSLVNRILTTPNYTLYAFAAGKNRNPALPGKQYFPVDINNMKSLKWQLNLIHPDYIINALAMTRVDACEEEKNLCTKVNVDFVSDLAEICADLDAHLIHISTDFVFDGKRGLYREDDPVNPINHYGWTKVMSEESVREKLNRYTILRTILVFGEAAGMKKSNIVLWIRKSLQERKKIKIVTDQLRMPTYVGNLTDACIAAVEHDATGIYHISGSDFLSVYEMALEVAGFYDLPKSLIIPVTGEEFHQKAARPLKTGFILYKAMEELGYRPLGLTEALLRYERERHGK